MIRNISAFTAVAFGIALCAASCSDNKARISGRFVGNGDNMVVLEQVSPQESMAVDSVITDSKGNFRFRISLPFDGPVRYNLKINDAAIPLIISEGENVRITSQYGTPANYSVEGSSESELVRELHCILDEGAVRLDSIANSRFLYVRDSAERKEGMRVYAKEFHKIKREHVRFIIANNGTIASVYALFQRLPNDHTLMNRETDVVYYRMVADSVSKYHSDSPYLIHLKSILNAMHERDELKRLLAENLKNPASYPEIELSDMYGNKQRLSDNHGKVILLDFCASASPEGAVNNAELKEIYEEYGCRGFEIYQVGLDRSKPAWVNAVQDQKLPWICVSDHSGIDGIVPRTYNINKSRSNYLINTEGEIVGRDLYGKRLKDEVARQVARIEK